MLFAATLLAAGCTKENNGGNSGITDGGDGTGSATPVEELKELAIGIHPSAQEVHNAVTSNGIAYYYGEDMKSWWDIKLSKEYDARYLVIHFRYGWDNGGTGKAASVMKVAELDIY